MKSTIVLCCILGLSVLSVHSKSVEVQNSTPPVEEDLPECPFPDPEFPVFHPDPTDCSRYYECSNGSPILLPCSPGLVWDPVLNTCNYDYPENPNPCKQQFQDQ